MDWMDHRNHGAISAFGDSPVRAFDEVCKGGSGSTDLAQTRRDV